MDERTARVRAFICVMLAWTRICMHIRMHAYVRIPAYARVYVRIREYKRLYTFSYTNGFTRQIRVSTAHTNVPIAKKKLLRRGLLHLPNPISILNWSGGYTMISAPTILRLACILAPTWMAVYILTCSSTVNRGQLGSASGYSEWQGGL